ncbi:hypothetical protein [Frigoriglobus tundricola]|uniref:Uncharacterized protein n=1 Tax=Frigoriglobus tundricola TaxID=2774151 RepID=A0A6M5YWU9_9BACT|nr:hypothetical protein [Frigoriglobus tundricola]QJW97412.1 hypothetical protein FTUN_4986 [Frigoriglobus tundricola]
MRTAAENTGAQIAYDVAYSVLPRRAHADAPGLRAEFGESPDGRAQFYFAEAAKGRRKQPRAELVSAVRGHTGRLDGKRDYIVIQFPLFPAVDLLADPSGGPAPPGGYVLAPYFLAVVIDRGSNEVRCFVLGQSPDARTTLRRVSPDKNVNLGRGCEPNLEDFLALLRQYVTR